MEAFLSVNIEEGLSLTFLEETLQQYKILLPHLLFTSPFPGTTVPLAEQKAFHSTDTFLTFLSLALLAVT